MRKMQTQKETSVSLIPTQSPRNSFFLNVSPRSLDKMTVNDLPNSKSIKGAALYKNHLWLSGDGTILEYDPVAKKITRYSNPSLAYCDSNLVIIDQYLYAPCRQVSAADMANYQTLPRYSVYKINLNTFAVEHIFTDKDGLTAQQNYFLVADGNTVWVGTDDGLGMIDTTSDNVTYFTSQLGTEAGAQTPQKFPITNIVIDGKFVWANVGADVYSKGSMSLFDKDTQVWQPFGPETLINRTDRFDLYLSGIKKVTNGIEIVSDGGTARVCNILKYDYTIKQWITAESQPFQGCIDRLSSQFPYTIYTATSLDANKLTQVTVGGNIYDIQGRANLVFSQIYQKKRYVLTSGTIDEMQSGATTPSIDIALGADMTNAISPNQLAISDVNLLIDPANHRGLAINSGCSPVGFCNEGTVWLFDLRTNKILKTYTQKFPEEAGFSVDKWTLQSQQNALIVNDGKNNQVFSIDTATYTYTSKQ